MCEITRTICPVCHQTKWSALKLPGICWSMDPASRCPQDLCMFVGRPAPGPHPCARCFAQAYGSASHVPAANRGVKRAAEEVNGYLTEDDHEGKRVMRSADALAKPSLEGLDPQLLDVGAFDWENFYGQGAMSYQPFEPLIGDLGYPLQYPELFSNVDGLPMPSLPVQNDADPIRSNMNEPPPRQFDPNHRL